MAKPLRGHCLCGHVRYEYAGEVGPATYCHCEDCRRCTGSAFNVGVQLEAAALRMLGGTSAVQPAAQIWLDSAVPWYEVPAGIASFAKGRTP